MKRLVIAVGFLWAATISGCASDPIPGGACVTNQDCTSGQQCVASRCVGATATGCKTDDACELGEFCDLGDGTCKVREVVGCATDVECPASQRCNTLTGVCIDGRRNCTDESQCSPIGKHCDVTRQQCVDCVDGTHCTAPLICTAGSCIDPAQSNCTMDPECAPPSTVCESGRCAAGCGEPGSAITCGPGTFCDTNTGRCVSGQVTCSMDRECNPPAAICESSQCIPGCTQVGGLQCTGGWVCNASSGRCEPAGGCTTDTQCGAPLQICEANQCVPGCAQVGGIMCGAGTVCDSSSGRCVMVQGPCTVDANCNPPIAVCETGQCVGGCAQPGGIQCSGNTICNQTTGRCDPGAPVCTSDIDCVPPSTICNTVTGACIPSCTTTGCPTGEMCNQTTGRCAVVGGGGTAPLNATCAVGSDCASSVCFPFGGTVGSRCVAACGNSSDCPQSFTCYNYDGGKMCISSQLFSGATFSTAPGGACTNGGQCRSNYCPNNQCMEQCSEDTDCPNGACRWSEFTTNRYIAACNGPAGAGANGASCSSDAQCRHGVCYGSGRCGQLCGSSTDCPNGNVCAPVNYSVCTVDLIFTCLEWQPNFVKACVQATHGQDPNGTTCANTSGSNCRGGFCYAPTNQCTSTCSRDADCPSTMACGVEEYGDLDGTTIYLNVCVPR